MMRADDASLAGVREPETERRLGDALAHHRVTAAAGLLKSVESWRKYAPEIAADRDEFLRRELFAFVDYMSLHFRTGDDRYRHLYIGEKLKQVYDPAASAEEQQNLRRDIPARDTAAVLDAMRPHSGERELAVLERFLKGVEGVLSAKASKNLRVLLIGDCLHLDVMSFLTVPCLEDGVSLEPVYLATKSASEVRSTARAMAARKFDLVFFSPFTYEQSPDLARLMEWRRAIDGREAVRRLVDSSLAEARATIDVLAEFYECPVLIHNTVNIRRHDGSPAELARCILTRRVRAIARDMINPAIAEHVENRSRATLGHLSVLDELPILARHSELSLGREFYSSAVQHPATLGMHVAAEYRDIIAVHARLRGKKLVMCDLDNTLWKGVIGEGVVEQHLDRQEVLKRLKSRGIVLAINSKNDPKNIRWDGAALGPDDFVASEITWDPKVVNTRRLADFLNLKPKDFVFVDDRPDEREMVAGAYPGLAAVDATDARTWRLLDLWAKFTSPEDDTDRTRFYKERELRQKHLDERLAAEDPAAMFATLGLRVRIRPAGAEDHRRVVELVNRTNQFNTCGSRITLRELTHWEKSGERRVLIASSADKFGDMGTVCVLMYERLPDRIRIPVFVLSCRVFGYGIETAVLNHVRRIAHAEGPIAVEGPMVETPNNGPCREVYANNSFAKVGDSWLLAATQTPGADPSWLTVERDDPAVHAAA